MRGFMPVGIMHCLAVELRPVIRRVLAARGHRSVVPLPVIQMMIYMAIEVVRAVEPRSSADEHAARNPFRAVISVWGAIVRRLFVVPVWANGRCANLHGYLRGSAIRCRKKQACSKSRQTKIFQRTHCFTSLDWRRAALRLVVSRHSSRRHLRQKPYRIDQGCRFRRLACRHSGSVRA